METLCNKCICARVCKYKEMGIEKIHQSIELIQEVQKFKECLEINISCKNYVENGDVTNEKLSK